MARIELDWNKYIEKSRQAAAEGIVMLKNDGALPIEKDKCIAVFGRIQNNYYKSGTGSGGMVNVTEVIGITEGLKRCGACLNTELIDAYAEWEKENPYNTGEGWGGEPWSQEEMPLDDDFVEHIAENSDCAVVVIGRSAGEETDSSAVEGSYYLSKLENEMMMKVRHAFKKMIVILNVGGVIDMSFVSEIAPDAVLYVWQGGMIGGLGAADVLLGKVNPCGKLSDTIANKLEYYPAGKNFGDYVRNFYCEDIYIGYRYFETFAKNEVLYPFGFGLSYTSFDINVVSASSDSEKVSLDVSVKNIGKCSGKEVVQIYCEAPQGKLGKPSRVLCGFEKTDELDVNQQQLIHLDIKLSEFASFDDTGETGNKSCFVLEEGKYNFYVGDNIRTAERAYTFELSETVVTEKLSQALAPVLPFDRIVNRNGSVTIESVSAVEPCEDKRRNENIPAEIAQTDYKGIRLVDVKNGKASMEEFIAQLSDDDLSCIIRGEGMGSPKVTAGTASAFGGVSDGLSEKGIPCACCADGPSGIRLDCGTKAFSIPNGTLLACTFNKKLVEELYQFVGTEVAANNIECLLGPGMNIHRYVLNGRNFEYFSEDPYLTGKMASAVLKGMHTMGVTGTIKHFCGNNQETKRHETDSVISERALREIYLKGFEIAVKDGKARSIMTTYGSVNGLWTAGSYDLVTTILRKEWGFNGIVMTDWWASINERGKQPDKSNFAAMIRAQNDLYMVCSDSAVNSSDDNTLSSLDNGTLTRGELQRSAMNICRFLMNTRALDRLENTADKFDVINCPSCDEDLNSGDIVFYKLDKKLTIPLDNVKAEKGKSYAFAFDIARGGKFRVTLTAKSDKAETAQMPVTVFAMGSIVANFTWNGTGGEWVTKERDIYMYSRFTACRIYFAQSGLELRDVTIEFLE